MNEKQVVADLTGWARHFAETVPSMDDLRAAMRKDVDDETLQRMCSYAGLGQWEPRIKTREVLCIYPQDEWSIAGFQEIIADAIKEIPADKRASATVTFSGGYDESCYLKIAYQEQETVEEFAVRIGLSLMYARKGQAADVATYERLKKRFG